ncbi:MAG TPA: NAD(P)H-quinone oxidoreductase [Terriglobales bacterium]|nr:NAD(P)H-quinone oxidoreductase [Terriglobales bacterium]
MKAVTITRPGGAEVLQVLDVAKPRPEASEVLVRVRASALNRADILQRRGKYPAPPGVPADIPGMEFAGEIESCGSSVQSWRGGERVMGLVGGGAHAEYLVAHERTLIRIPSNLSWEQAAAIPEAFITAHDALWIQADLRPGERVLIHAVGSGVGLAAVQLTRAMNALAFGTSRTAEKIKRAKEYGLHSGFVVSSSPAPEDSKRWTAEGAFDVVLDLAGGSYTNASLHALAPRGRILLIGTMAGTKSELDLGLMLSKRAHMIGTVLRARPLEEKIAVSQSFAKQVVPLFTSGVLCPVIDSQFALSDIQRAHERMELNESFGKIVLRMTD